MAGGFEEYLSWCVPGSPDIPVTQHMLGQNMIVKRGDTAKAETYVFSYHRIKADDEERNTAMGERYLDKLKKRDGNWKIVSRTMLYDWERDLGVAADWSKRLMGMSFKGDHYTGRSSGDFSDTWFD